MTKTVSDDVVYLSSKEYKKIPNNTIVHWKKAGEWKIEVYKNKNIVLRKRGASEHVKKHELKDLSSRYPSCDIKSNIKRPNVSWYLNAPIILRENHELNLTKKEEIYFDHKLADLRSLLEDRNAKSKLATLESIKLGTIRSIRFIEHTSK